MELFIWHSLIIMRVHWYICIYVEDFKSRNNHILFAPQTPFSYYGRYGTSAMEVLGFPRSDWIVQHQSWYIGFHYHFPQIFSSCLLSFYWLKTKRGFKKGHFNSSNLLQSPRPPHFLKRLVVLTVGNFNKGPFFNPSLIVYFPSYIKFIFVVKKYDSVGDFESWTTWCDKRELFGNIKKIFIFSMFGSLDFDIAFLKLKSL